MLQLCKNMITNMISIDTLIKLHHNQNKKYNSKISKTNLIYPDWFNNGIHTIADVVDSDSVIYDYKNLKLNYN